MELAVGISALFEVDEVAPAACQKFAYKSLVLATIGALLYFDTP